MASVVLGCGAALPPRVVTNEDLAGPLGTDAATIAERTGVTQRHYADEGVGPSHLGTEAARHALAAAGLGPRNVDLIVFATMTPDLAFPGSGCFLQDQLACDTVGALDVRAECAGFLFALATADRFVEAGSAERALVVGAEVHSSALDQTPRAATVSPRFGDGAGALLLGRGDAPGVLASVLHTDTTSFEDFWCEFPSSRHRPARMEMAQYERGLHYYVLDAAALDRRAEPALAARVSEVLARAGIGASAVDLCIAHYLDPRVARRAVVSAGITGDRVVTPAAEIGHVAGAGIPIALAQAQASGRIGPGSLVCCVAFGAGVNSAGMVLRL